MTRRKKREKNFEEITEVENFKERVEYLAMKNAALKKLRALVQEEYARRIIINLSRFETPTRARYGPVRLLLLATISGPPNR